MYAIFNLCGIDPLLSGDIFQYKLSIIATLKMPYLERRGDGEGEEGEEEEDDD